MKVGTWKGICLSVFTVALLTITKKVEVIQVFISRWVDMVCTHSGTLINFQRNEIPVHFTIWMNLEDIWISETTRHEFRYYMISLRWGILTNLWKIWCLPNLLEEIGSHHLVGMDFLFRKIESVLEMDGHDDCVRLWTYSIPLNCTLKICQKG